MAMAGTRYEVRVGTRVSEATLAAFRIAVRPTVVPRNTVYRLRVPADRDLAEAVEMSDVARRQNGKHLFAARFDDGQW